MSGVEGATWRRLYRTGRETSYGAGMRVQRATKTGSPRKQRIYAVFAKTWEEKIKKKINIK